jgi:hypothetical protein
MPVKTKKKSILGFLAAVFSMFSRRPKPDNNDLKKNDFKTSTQSMGVRFNEHIRNVFRFRWIHKT